MPYVPCIVYMIVPHAICPLYCLYDSASCHMSPASCHSLCSSVSGQVPLLHSLHPALSYRAVATLTHFSATDTIIVQWKCSDIAVYQPGWRWWWCRSGVLVGWAAQWRSVHCVEDSLFYYMVRYNNPHSLSCLANKLIIKSHPGKAVSPAVQIFIEAEIFTGCSCLCAPNFYNKKY